MLKKFPFFDTDFMCCGDQKIRLKQLQSGGSYRALMPILIFWWKSFFLQIDSILYLLDLSQATLQQSDKSDNQIIKQ